MGNSKLQKQQLFLFCFHTASKKLQSFTLGGDTRESFSVRLLNDEITVIFLKLKKKNPHGKSCLHQDDVDEIRPKLN